MPGVNRAAVSYTARKPFSNPMKRKESPQAKVIMFTSAVGMDKTRLGENKMSPSSFAAAKAERRSSSVEKTRPG